ncbi:sensor histidine kinase [Paenibacillus turpanensis]|uniref:sensor histidine kinase n=1 Tax=Paenibacillus turpanensis TaxID=2689078 RepID=UPI00140E79A1|nr:HAMP domain-containing sensor histidine kinase [Paenibacillus turpanensis]
MAKSPVRIILRFLSATLIISISLLVVNFALLPFWISNGVNEGQTPAEVVRLVAGDLQGSDGDYSLDATSEGLLEELQGWAMLIDSEGHVIWRHQLPEELPSSYSLTDVAQFSFNYLQDYPVFVWEHPEGLMVVGYPKGSLAKYQHIFPTSWVKDLPQRVGLLLLGNIALVLLVSLVIGSLLVRSIRPLTQGIEALAQDREVQLKPKGILADLAQSVNHASALLRRKNESLQSRDEARASWIAGVSHDIRTPLSMVLGYASELEEHGDIPAPQRRQAGIIRHQAEKLRALVSDLNLVSLLEYEMQPLHLKPIRLAALTRQVASDILNQGLDPHFTLHIDEMDESARVQGDERLLLRALTNLVENSIKHNPDGCEIRLQVSVDESEQRCRVKVRDDGKGIPESTIRDMGELPYAVKRKIQNKDEPSGGLGLPMAAKICRAHHGDLMLSSGECGKGLTAELRLPMQSG